MLVRDWMTVNVISLGVNSSVLDAAEFLREKNIRQFPVIDSQGRLVGIVSDRDIRDAMPSKFIPGDSATERGGGLYTLTASDIMTSEPISVHSDTAMTEVAEVLVKNKVGGLPVVDAGRLKGIITQADVLRFLCTASGSLRGGAQFAIRMDGRPELLADLLCEIRNVGIIFTSVFTAHDPVHSGYTNAYVTVADMGDMSVEEVVNILQEKYELLFYVVEGVTVDME
ncbi:CBS domain-containing protein [Pseudodesulfovibrio sp. JC047]|uniref:CBS domain-containing protein n=1 Tax=Pseudodesulfovibrio sp. JC047 TaxID=2683199 RepID=UPI0013D77461|nr:CBS domain-containing protein [Pseudodesulfovibrio sp. JC047]NDV18163.1 CBS domain-containing protein [Pseudodesulfovibrio sp. JC047]